MADVASFAIAGDSAMAATGVQVYLNPSGQSVQESATAKGPLASALAAGVNNISQNQTVTFQPYVRCVLPLDGFVFWVRASLLGPSALYNTAAYNAAAYDEPMRANYTLPDLVAQGSYHVSTTQQQNEDETFGVNRVVFTSLVLIEDLNAVSPMLMYIAEVDGVRFAFGQRGSFYRQADLYHYSGEALYPALASQIIDDVIEFDSSSLVISNSLPIWLALNRVMPVFPSYLVPDNIRPPYASVDIPPDSTRALQSAPLIDQDSNHWQLVTERVKFTIYGLRNFSALSFQDYVLQQSLYSGLYGVMNSPVVRDEKRTQPEMSIIAQKKSLELEINYYQAALSNVARQLILEAIPTFYTQSP